MFVNKVTFSNTDQSWEAMEAKGEMEVDEDGGEALLGEGGALQAGGVAFMPGMSEDAAASFSELAVSTKVAGAKAKAKAKPKGEHGSQNRSGSTDATRQSSAHPRALLSVHASGSCSSFKKALF